MQALDRRAREASDTPASRRLSVVLLATAVVGLALQSYSTAQAPRRPLLPVEAASRALDEGRYDEVEGLTAGLDLASPRIVSLRARAAIARGRYGHAEATLRPVAQRLPTSEAALHLGLLQQMLGRADAVSVLSRVAALADTSYDADELARAGRALRAIGGRFQEANAAFREAAGGAPRDPAIQTAWGELFLEKYQKAEAMKSFQMAIDLDARSTPALMGAARTLQDENPPKAVAFAERALAVNPWLVDAHVLLAEQAADAGHHDEARASLEKALAVNPSSLEARAQLAALAYVADKPAEFEAEVARTLAIAPGYGEVYRVAGALAARNYRFDEAVALTRRALALNGRDPRALADLGTHLLRTGDEPGARAALEAAWKVDDYNALTKNQLDMMDALDAFVTVRDGDLVVRLHRDEAAVLQEYAVSIAHQALETMAARYEFTPRGPILVEIFPRHDDFAVRTVGLPGMVGALGVCFGRVVAMDSPRAKPGEFQWEATLWHELGHVVTLQMSNQRLPRWLSEGISEYEEMRARPEWGRGMELTFAGLLNRGETIELKDLNAAFTNPETISLAYFQASLLVEHLMSVYGQAGVNKLVRAYGQGIEADAALKVALHTDFDRLQVGFDEMVERRFGNLRRAMDMPDGVQDLLKLPLPALRTIAAANPGSYPIQIAFGRALRRASATDEAMQVFERAAALAPAAGGRDSPHEQMAAIALENKDYPRAIAELTALVAVDFNNVEAARQLATLLRQGGVDDPARLGPVYQRIAAIDPFDADAHAQLGRLAMRRNDPEAASREFRTVVALAPVDRTAAFTDLAESYYKGGKRAEAKKLTLAALEIAPTYERAQELLLKLVEGGRP